MQSFPQLKEGILQNFIGRHKYSKANGKGSQFYSRILSPQHHQLANDYIRESYPILWEKYLNRYEAK